LAPFFTAEFDCVAISNSGNGESEWRPAYSFDIWAEEIIAVAKDAGMTNESTQRCKPIIVAHSMGVLVALAAEEKFAHLIGGLILLDQLPRPANFFVGAPKHPAPKFLEHKIRTREDPGPRSALKLAPPQREMNRFLIDFVADHSIRTLEGNRWVWSFDPQKEPKMQESLAKMKTLDDLLSVDMIRRLHVKTAFIVGDRSAVLPKEVVEYNRFHLGDEFPIIELRDCAHHLMFDQPLALVAAIESILGEWKRSQLTTVAGKTIPRLEQRASQSNFDVATAPKLTWRNFMPPLAKASDTTGTRDVAPSTTSRL
jgi:pimeloyl-ACP methyl ester carboxylesterase